MPVAVVVVVMILSNILNSKNELKPKISFGLVS